MFGMQHQRRAVGDGEHDHVLAGPRGEPHGVAVAARLAHENRCRAATARPAPHGSRARLGLLQPPRDDEGNLFRRRGHEGSAQMVNGVCARKALALPSTNRLGDWLSGRAARMRAWKLS